VRRGGRSWSCLLLAVGAPWERLDSTVPDPVHPYVRSARDASAHSRRQLHHRARARRGRHVPGLSRRGDGPGAAGRHQDPAGRAGPRRVERAVSAGDPARRATHPPAHRSPAHGRRERRSALVHHAVPRGHHAARPARPGAALDPGRRERAARRRPRAGLRPRARRRPPRHQAGERAPHRRHGHGDGLRHRQGAHRGHRRRRGRRPSRSRVAARTFRPHWRSW
jgi:hypothetical protein